MGLSVKVGSFQKSIGSAPASQGITGLGFQPKALILFTCGGTALNTAGGGVLGAVGFAAGASSVGSFGFAMQDGVSPTNTSERMAAKALTVVQWGETLLAECDLTSFDSDGFTLNWTTNNATAYYIGYIAFGGTDITGAKVVSWQTPAATGDKAVTGVGFQPTALFDISTGITAAPPTSAAYADLSFGFAASDGSHQCVSFRSADNIAGGFHDRSIVAPAVVTDGLNEDGTHFHVGRFKSFDSDGFTVFNDVVFNGIRHYTLCLQGLAGNTATAYKPTGAAPASHSVPMFRAMLPAAAILASDQKAFHASTGGSVPAYFGLGFTDGVNSVCMAVTADYSTTTKCKQVFRDDKWFMKIANSTGTQDAVADTPSFSNNTITTSWSTNDAVEAAQMWVALSGVLATNPSSGISRAAAVNRR